MGDQVPFFVIELVGVCLPALGLYLIVQALDSHCVACRIRGAKPRSPTWLRDHDFLRGPTLGAIAFSLLLSAGTTSLGQQMEVSSHLSFRLRSVLFVLVGTLLFLWWLGIVGKSTELPRPPDEQLKRTSPAMYKAQFSKNLEKNLQAKLDLNLSGLQLVIVSLATSALLLWGGY